MYKNLKIRSKIFISVLTINIVVIFSIFLLYYNFSQNAILEETNEKIQIKMQEINSILKSKLQNKAKIAWTFCKQPKILDWLKNNEIRYVDRNEDKVFDEIVNYFNRIIRDDGEIGSAFISSEKTRLYYDQKEYRVNDDYDVRKRPWYINTVKNKAPMFDVSIGFTEGTISLNYRYPMFDENNTLLGVGGIDLALETVNRYIESINLFETGYVMIVNIDGTILYHPNEDYIIKKNINQFFEQDDKDQDFSELVDKITSGEKGIEKAVFDGQERMIVFAPVEGLDWSLLVSVSEDEINAPLSGLANNSIIILVLSTLVLLVSIVFVANSIAKPINLLSDEIIKSSEKGSLSIESKIDSRDEVGKLSNAFHKMLSNMKTKVSEVDRIASGDFSVDVDVISDEDLLGKSMVTLKNRISSVVEDITVLSTEALSGNLNIRSDASKHNGEFRKIVEGINKTIEAFLAPIYDASKTIEKIASKDLTARVTGNYLGDHAKLKDLLNLAAKNLQDVLNKVHTVVEQNDNAVQDINVLTEEIVNGISAQTDNTIEVASSMEEMTSTITQNAGNAQLMSDTANNSKDSAEKGGEIVNKTIEGMQRIEDEVNKSAKLISLLDESIKRIGDIVSVIEDIANQTNLLALNAAIEAARAGEHGRGFTIVADEVGKLAVKTTQATQEIYSMVNNVKEDSMRAIKSMDNAITETKNGLELTNSAGDALRGIVKTSIDLSEKVTQLAQANEDQSNVSVEISSKVDFINTATQEFASKIQSVQNYMNDFTIINEQLKELNSQFILTKVQSKNTLIPANKIEN